MLNGVGAPVAWSILQKKGETLQARFEAQKTVTRDVDRFRERAAQIGSIEELMKDRKTLQFVLEAYQLEGEIDKRAIVNKLLTDDPADVRSFANRMVDPRYRQINRDFGTIEGPPLADAALVEKIIDQALTNRFEKAQGEANPGVREAMYFKRLIANVTDVNGLMSDRVLTTVARGALGLPDKFGLLEFEQQKRILEKRIDFEQFKDPKQVDKFIQNYLIKTQNEQAPAASNPMMALFGGGGGSAGLLSLIGRQV
ncbi:DUF1217 domain-containing protein [Elioraea rosea]|uniref:DUF1217 domain-containing protein n=1 Tax=Elioraea rosea TaxID=2492390 RepID=UPI0011865C9B|nr:DUF1217 domain-containing protein [Elioraea rosea]